jgi:hypothetical protein
MKVMKAMNAMKATKSKQKKQKADKPMNPGDQTLGQPRIPQVNLGALLRDFDRMKAMKAMKAMKTTKSKQKNQKANESAMNPGTFKPANQNLMACIHRGPCSSTPQALLNARTAADNVRALLNAQWNLELVSSMAQRAAAAASAAAHHDGAQAQVCLQAMTTDLTCEKA